MRGAGVAINNLLPGTLSYISNGFDIMKNLNINSLHLMGGIEGNVWNIRIDKFPEWATNLNNLLNLISSNGLKAYFHAMGSGWANLLGIVPPQSPGSNPMIPINDALAMIDKLAGNNELGHNFITDNRVIGWIPSNESDLTISTDLNWILTMCDYIRSLGGKSWVAAPRGIGGWGPGQDLSIVEPLLRGHIDYLDYHLYGIWELVNNYGGIVTPEWISWYKSKLQKQIDYIDSIGWPRDKLLLGEFGIWLGYGEDMNTIYTFTDEVRRDYYQATLNIMNEVGFRNVFNHNLFEQQNPSGPATVNYGIVNLDGSYYLPAYEIKKAYTTPISSLGTLLRIIGPIGFGLYFMSRSRRRG